MNCIRADHYSSDEAQASNDPHHHCAGRVEVVDGRTVVVDATPCEVPCGVCQIVRPSPQMGYCYSCRRERCFACKDRGHDQRCTLPACSGCAAGRPVTGVTHQLGTKEHP